MTDPTEARRLAPAIPTSRQERVKRWGDGPWIDEPDREEWREAGLPCLVRRVPHGSLCGYVAVPPGHPLHGKDPGHGEIEAALRVHGGLTYASACDGEVCHVPEPGESDAVWWFGFDTGHAFDYVPALWINPLRGGRYSAGSQSFAAEVRAEIDELDDDSGMRMRYRDFAYVRAQTARLARQLAELARPVFIGVDHAAIRAGAKPRNSAEARYLLQLRDEAERQPDVDDKP